MGIQKGNFKVERSAHGKHSTAPYASTTNTNARVTYQSQKFSSGICEFKIKAAASDLVREPSCCVPTWQNTEGQTRQRLHKASFKKDWYCYYRRSLHISILVKVICFVLSYWTLLRFGGEYSNHCNAKLWVEGDHEQLPRGWVLPLALQLLNHSFFSHFFFVWFCQDKQVIQYGSLTSDLKLSWLKLLRKEGALLLFQIPKAKQSTVQTAGEFIRFEPGEMPTPHSESKQRVLWVSLTSETGNTLLLPQWEQKPGMLQVGLCVELRSRSSPTLSWTCTLNLIWKHWWEQCSPSWMERKGSRGRCVSGSTFLIKATFVPHKDLLEQTNCFCDLRQPRMEWMIETRATQGCQHWPWWLPRNLLYFQLCLLLVSWNQKLSEHIFFEMWKTVFVLAYESFVKALFIEIYQIPINPVSSQLWRSLIMIL